MYQRLDASLTPSSLFKCIHSPRFNDRPLTPLSFISALHFTTSRPRQMPAAVLPPLLAPTCVQVIIRPSASRLQQYITAHSDIKTLGGRISRSRAVTHIFVIRRFLAMVFYISKYWRYMPLTATIDDRVALSSRKRHAWHRPMFGYIAITRGRANRARAK